MPVFSVKTASAVTGRTPTATMSAIERRLEAGFVAQATVQKSIRSFEIPEIIDDLGDLERSLASPAGDARTNKPVESVDG